MILGIDTSGKNLGLAICAKGKEIASSLTTPGLKHGKIIQLMIDKFISENKIEFSSLTGISVVIGPGSFTGLRIGLSAAKGYCYALNLPITGIDTLFAGSFAGFSGKVVVLTDARRSELYYAEFDCSGKLPERLTPDRISPYDKLGELASDDVIFLGPEHLKDRIRAETGTDEYHNSDNFNLAIPASLIGEKDFENNKNPDLDSLVPFYLRTDF